MSRLDFAPKPKEMEVTEIETGHFVFSPLPGKKVVYGALEKAIVGAGYKIEKVWIEVTGKLAVDAQVHVEDTDQTFRLIGDEALSRLHQEVDLGSHVTVFGQWKSTSEVETIVLEKWSAQ